MIDKLEEKLGKGRVRENVNLFVYVTLRTKVKARYFFEARTRDDLIKAKKLEKELGVHVYFVGGGSNVVFLKDFEGLLVKNFYMKKELIKEDKNSVELLVSSGYPITKLVTETKDAGYEGLEYQLGLPGTVGGAIYMNSKWTRPLSYFGDTLVFATVVDADGNVKKVERESFQFAYDTSILQKTKEIVLEAAFRLKKTDPEIVKKRSQESLEYRKATQPFGVSSSGCFFQNISEGEQERLQLFTTSAGYLIDQAGLKGTQVGNFIVSDKHANFILNKGDGQPEDLVKLLQIIQDTVKKKFELELKREVILV